MVLQQRRSPDGFHFRGARHQLISQKEFEVTSKLITVAISGT
jgi:hypothetical protein